MTYKILFVLQETHDFSAEIRYLEHVLSSLQQELDDTQTQLLETQEEVKCLRMGNSEYSAKLLEVQSELELERERVAELARENEALRQQLSSSELQSLKEEVKRGQDKVVELWHTNCQQLLNHDDEMFKKDEEIKILSDKLQKLEIELATMKLERLSAGTSTSVSQSISSSFVGSVPGGVSVSILGPEGCDNKPITATIPRWSGGFGTTTRAEVVKTTLSTVPLRVCLASTTNTNTQSTLLSYLSIAPSVPTSAPSVLTSGMSYLTRSTTNPRISHTTQPEKQVTMLVLLYLVLSLPVDQYILLEQPSLEHQLQQLPNGVVNSHSVAMVKHPQSMNLLVRTVELHLMTGYQFLKEQLPGMGGHKMSC